jgi:hypothetical protein
MLLKLFDQLMKPGPVQRGIAVFFLVFTFMDIVFIDLLGQGSCSEEAAALPFVRATLIVSDEIAENNISRFAYIWNAAHDQPAHPTDHTPTGNLDEDCFCCCSHLMAGIGVYIADLNGPAQPDDPAIISLPSSPPRGTFHPPRLS